MRSLALAEAIEQPAESGQGEAVFLPAADRLSRFWARHGGHMVRSRMLGLFVPDAE